MTFVEQLVFEWLDYRGYITRCNIRVGRLKKGGYSGEIDIAAYHPTTRHCIHVECHTDAGSWKQREAALKKKFDRGARYIFKEVFPWLQIPGGPELEQWAVVVTAGKDRKTVAGRRVVSLRQVYRNITRDIVDLMVRGNRMVPEKYPLLRAVQGMVQHVLDSKKNIEALANEDLLPRLTE